MEEKKSVFEPIHMEWNGEKFTIPANRVLGAIARIEEHVTLNELRTDAGGRGTVRMVVLSRAYASVLRYAGAAVADEEVYESIFEKTGGARMLEAIQGLMMLMIPPSKLRSPEAGKTTKGKSRSSTTGSSKKRSRRSSGTAVSSRGTSGT